MDKIERDPDYEAGYKNGYEDEMAAIKAAKEAGPEVRAADEKQRNLLAVLLINLVNTILAILGIPKRIVGGSWKPPAPKNLAKAAAADEATRQGLDEPREVLRVARRVRLGAEITNARLSEPVMGALLTASKQDLADLIGSDMNRIATWAAAERGEAARAEKPEPVQTYNRDASYSQNLNFRGEPETLELSTAR